MTMLDEALAVCQMLVDAEKAVTNNANFVLLVEATDMAREFLEKHCSKNTVPPHGPDGYICQRCRQWIGIEHVCKEPV